MRIIWHRSCIGITGRAYCRKKTVKNSNVKLIVGLAPYRVTQGNGDVWNAGDILKRQVSDARAAANYGGFIMFRYDFFFSDTLKTERDNLKGILG